MSFQKDKWYFIEFYDHSKGSSPLDVITCQIIGKYHSSDKVQHAFIVWENTHKDHQEANREYVSVVKGTIIKKKKIDI